MSARFWLLFELVCQRDLALLLGRILVVIQLIPNGFRKIASFQQTAAMMGGAPPQMIDGRLFPAQEPLFHFPFPQGFLTISLSLDILGAVLLIIGFRTRPVAFILALYVMLAMTIYHFDIRGVGDVVAILRNLPFVGGLILISGVGAGRWSMDGLLLRKQYNNS